VIGPVDCEPLAALLPLQVPDAAHAVALALAQVKVEAAPEFTVLGAAVSVIVGAAFATVTVAVCVAEPPAAPVQVSIYSVVLVSTPVGQLPLVETAPLHPPDAVQALA
jgi:hypothetical protein